MSVLFSVLYWATMFLLGTAMVLAVATVTCILAFAIIIAIMIYIEKKEKENAP